MVSRYRDVWVKDDLLSPCSLATGMAQARGLLVLGWASHLAQQPPEQVITLACLLGQVGCPPWMKKCLREWIE